MAKTTEASKNMQIDNMQLNDEHSNNQNFSIEGKVALITGAASGLGYSFAKDLLEHGIRGLTIVDVNCSLAETVCNEFKKKYGKEKVIFIEADVVDKEQLEVAFKETVSTFGAIDILINNAGILDDHQWHKELGVNLETVSTFGAIDILINNAGILDDHQWHKELGVNLTGTINGILLGLEHYIQKYKSGPEGVIVNVCSVSGVGGPMAFPMPIYTYSKFAVHGLTITFGCNEHFQRTGVRIVAICPGITDTPLANIFKNLNNITLGKPYSELLGVYTNTHTTQRPESCASGLTQIIKRARTGTVWICEGGQKAYQYELPDRFNIPKVYLD